MPESTPPPFSRLYPILDASNADLDSYLASIGALGRAGCRLIQLRAKALSGRELYEWARRGVEAALEAGTSLIVNDRADVALVTGAVGVHLGQDDLSARAARKILGDGAVIGLSTHDSKQAGDSEREPVDYVAIGPVFSTSTKRDAERPVGIVGVRAVRELVSRPLVAIGGITLDTAPAVLEAGVDGVAVVSALRLESLEGLEELARRWLEATELGQ